MSNIVITGTTTYHIDASTGTIHVTIPEIDNLSTTTSGTLRVEMWLTTTPWNEDGSNTGHKLAVFPIEGSALAAGGKILSLDSTFSYIKPPAGSYYLTLAVTEYTGASVDNGYSVDATRHYAKLLTFDAKGNVTLNDLVTPTVSVATQTIEEGDKGTSYMVFTLKLSQASLLPSTVHFDTTDQTAVDGVDYLGVHQTVTFAAGATTATVKVPIVGNTDFEPTRVFGVALSDAVNITTDSTSHALGYIADDDGGSWLPTDGFTDLEWYLYTTNTVFAWTEATGKGVKVAVFDNGIDATNPDLTANVRTDLGRTTLTMTAGGAPVDTGDNHGTTVAGVIASARDGSGTIGVAYDAQLVSLYTADKITSDLLTEITNAYQYAAKTVDIINDSWGYGNLLMQNTNWAFLDNANDPAFAPAFKALHDLAAEGRDGLGTVVVQSAGNAYNYGDDTNLHNFQNSRYIITVGATDYFGDTSSFSTSGASILVAAPGGSGDGNYSSIITTDRTGAAGNFSGNYAFADGTSYSAPIVSGIVALMLEVNPNLGYRDVQQILAYSAHQTDYANGVVTANGATDWNGGGLQFVYGAQTTGFGQVDALAAVRLAESWDTAPRTVANTVDVVASKTVKQAIPDNDVYGVTSTINVTSDIVVERVDVSVNITHPFIGDLQIALTSPTGTTSFLMYRPSQGALSAYGSSQNDVHFTFDTVLDWGELATGAWSLNVVDLDTGAKGTFTDWTLDLIGHAASKDNTYFYTWDYASALADDPSRGILNDTDGGNDTINLATLVLDNYVDLTGATLSNISGSKLTIAAGTTVRNAWGGSGDDTIIANALGGTLHGMNGDDILTGGAGKDLLDGGDGNDILTGGAGTDMALYHLVRADYSVIASGTGYTVKALSGSEGTDTLIGVERLQFSDTVLAFDSGKDGTAGQAYRLYQAAFDRTPDSAGLGYWIGKMDDGVSLKDVAQGFVQSNEFKTLYGAAPTNTELLDHMYENVLHRAPDVAGAAYWMDLLDQHKVDAVELLINFSESAENIAALVGVTQNGISYTPYVG